MCSSFFVSPHLLTSCAVLRRPHTLSSRAIFYGWQVSTSRCVRCALLVCLINGTPDSFVFSAPEVVTNFLPRAKQPRHSRFVAAALRQLFINTNARGRGAVNEKSGTTLCPAYRQSAPPPGGGSRAGFSSPVQGALALLHANSCERPSPNQVLLS